MSSSTHSFWTEFFFVSCRAYFLFHLFNSLLHSPTLCICCHKSFPCLYPSLSLSFPFLFLLVFLFLNLYIFQCLYLPLSSRFLFSHRITHPHLSIFVSSDPSLSQIRLMIAASALIARGTLPEIAMEMALVAPFFINLPLAPAEGLIVVNAGFERNSNGKV